MMIAASHEFPSEQLPSPPNLEVVTVSMSLVPAIICCMVCVPSNATVEYHTELINYLQSLPSHVKYLVTLICLILIGPLLLEAQQVLPIFVGSYSNLTLNN